MSNDFESTNTPPVAETTAAEAEPALASQSHGEASESSAVAAEPQAVSDWKKWLGKQVSEEPKEVANWTIWLTEQQSLEPKPRLRNYLEQQKVLPESEAPDFLIRLQHLNAERINLQRIWGHSFNLIEQDWKAQERTDETLAEDVEESAEEKKNKWSDWLKAQTATTDWDERLKNYKEAWIEVNAIDADEDSDSEGKNAVWTEEPNIVNHFIQNLKESNSNLPAERRLFNYQIPDRARNELNLHHQEWKREAEKLRRQSLMPDEKVLRDEQLRLAEIAKLEAEIPHLEIATIALRDRRKQLLDELDGLKGWLGWTTAAHEGRRDNINSQLAQLEEPQYQGGSQILEADLNLMQRWQLLAEKKKTFERAQRYADLVRIKQTSGRLVELYNNAVKPEVGEGGHSKADKEWVETAAKLKDDLAGLRRQSEQRWLAIQARDEAYYEQVRALRRELLHVQDMQRRLTKGVALSPPAMTSEIVREELANMAQQSKRWVEEIWQMHERRLQETAASFNSMSGEKSAEQMQQTLESLKVFDSLQPARSTRAFERALPSEQQRRWLYDEAKDLRERQGEGTRRRRCWRKWTD